MKYIIVEETWEYNDEYYHQPDSGDSYTIKSKLYSSEELAQEDCDKLNQKVKEEDSEWFVTYDSDEVIQPYKVISIEE